MNEDFLMDEIALSDWLQLIALVASMLTLAYAMWYRAHIVPLKNDLNGWGERVKLLELSRERDAANQRQSEQLLRDTARDVLHLSENVGRVLAWAERNSAENLTLKQEIVGFASERFDKLTKEVAAIRQELAVVARLQEEQMEDERRRVDRERAP